MRIALSVTAVLMSILVLGAERADAQYWQGTGTWCTVPLIGGGTWSCSYYSEAQCQASASGRNLGCARNPSDAWDRIEGKQKQKGKRRSGQQDR